MRCLCTLTLALSGVVGCGSTPKSEPVIAGPAQHIEKPKAAVSLAPEPLVSKPEVSETPVPKPPIAIPGARLHDGYVLGGLPSKEQFDEAYAAGFESAMSLMANDEDGIREIAPYASSLGVRYIRFTVRGTEDLNESMAWQFASTLGMLGRPAIIHSANGERAGAMFALMAFFVDEASADEALAIGRLAGMGSLEAHLRGVLVRD
tara:strand:- start:228 stop:842 length:615 start_codon:yes stop_codon:yes gene_type:complete